MCAIYFADTNETERQRDTKKGPEAKRKMQEARLFCGTVTTAEKSSTPPSVSLCRTGKTFGCKTCRYGRYIAVPRVHLGFGVL